MGGDDNLSAVVHGVNDLRLENTPIPVIKENEVLLRMSHVGICGTDISFLTKGKIGNNELNLNPMITGHEATGVVTKCGAAVKHLKIGDRVAVEPSIPCLACDYCKSGRIHLCGKVILCSTPALKGTMDPPMQGTLARYYKHHADYCHKLPDHVSSEEGAVLEPLTCAVHACHRANIVLGSTVLICGSGSIGLLCMMTARAMGATKICVTDIVDQKLDFAKTLGADCTLNVRSGTPEELAKQVAKLMGGQMPNITMECTGIESSIRMGTFATKSGGRLVLVGLGAPDAKIPVVNAATREVDIVGSVRFVNDFPLALELLATGRVNVKALITHRFKIEETLEAFETLKTGKGNPIKVMVTC